MHDTTGRAHWHEKRKPPTYKKQFANGHPRAHTPRIPKNDHTYDRQSVRQAQADKAVVAVVAVVVGAGGKAFTQRSIPSPTAPELLLCHRQKRHCGHHDNPQTLPVDRRERAQHSTLNHGGHSGKDKGIKGYAKIVYKRQGCVVATSLCRIFLREQQGRTSGKTTLSHTHIYICVIYITHIYIYIGFFSYFDFLHVLAATRYCGFEPNDGPPRELHTSRLRRLQQ